MSRQKYIALVILIVVVAFFAFVLIAKPVWGYEAYIIVGVGMAIMILYGWGGKIIKLFKK